MNWALALASGLGLRIISLLRQRVEEEVAALNDPNAVQGVATNPDGVDVTLLVPGSSEPSVVKITRSQLAGLAKTQRVVNRVSGILPNGASPFANQLIRALIENALLIARVAGAKKESAK